MKSKTPFPVPTLSAALEREWSRQLALRAGVTQAEFEASPSQYMNFPIEDVQVELMDGSLVKFKYAFAIVSEELMAVAVFTEHCGHHVFPFHEAKVYQAGKLVWQQGEAIPSLERRPREAGHLWPAAGSQAQCRLPAKGVLPRRSPQLERWGT
jgi:hypothetical protein